MNRRLAGLLGVLTFVLGAKAFAQVVIPPERNYFFEQPRIRPSVVEMNALTNYFRVQKQLLALQSSPSPLPPPLTQAVAPLEAGGRLGVALCKAAATAAFQELMDQVKAAGEKKTAVTSVPQSPGSHECYDAIWEIFRKESVVAGPSAPTR